MLALEEQVGPDLGFHDHGDARSDPIEETPHRCWQIVGEVDVEDLVAPQLTHSIRSGRCHRGHYDALVGVATAQRLH